MNVLLGRAVPDSQVVHLISRDANSAIRLSRMIGRVTRIGLAVLAYLATWRLLIVLITIVALSGATMSETTWARIALSSVSVIGILILLAQLNLRVDSVRADFVGATLQSTETPPGPGSSPNLRRGSQRHLRPVVTVVIPGRNESAFVRDCIHSLKDQDIEHFEVVIIDDCSTDDTLDRLLEAIEGDPRFRVFRTMQSVGPGLARNFGASQSRTTYITFLDMDDFMSPDALRSRVEAAAETADLPWVAGSYCWHETLDLSATPDLWEPTSWAPNTPISWLGHHDDNVFIVSAPLIRRDAFLGVGGFDDMGTAEDPILWFKMLRWGFVFVGTGTIGVGYRQKPSSRAVSTAIAMREAVASLLRDRNHATERPSNQTGPYFYNDDMANYRSLLGFAKRTASALGLAVASGADDNVSSALVGDLSGVPNPLVGWEVDIKGMATAAARRVVQANPDLAIEPIERRLGHLLDPVIQQAKEQSRAWVVEAQAPSAMPLPTQVYPVRTPRLIGVTEQSIKRLIEGPRPVLLLPSASYHTDELIELVPELRSRGYTPLAMLNDFRWNTTGKALARVDVSTVAALPVGDWLSRFVGLVTFNDWGEYYAEYVRASDDQTVSFAKVEGVQDWDDVDTGRIRNAYLSADVVLCQGINDVRALEGRRSNLEIVGSARLERIWHEPLPPERPPRVTANVNFTYGVLTEHRDMWVEGILSACSALEIPIDLSMHPSETAEFPGLASALPLRHLLTENSILVSRFSTVLFEGMARGCSVIYYNPHGEKVPTFNHPEGAFEVATSVPELTGALQRATRHSRHETKEMARPFFENQVSIDRDSPVASRTVDVIDKYLARLTRPRPQ